jgi:hypothetical protein
MHKKITQLEFPTLELAWEGINEYLLNQEAKVRAHGGGSYGTELVSYDNYIHVFKSTVSDNFNFGEILGYKYKKWSKLINNYVNMNYLDLIKSEVLDRERKKSTHYNFTMHFDNSHGSGKDCLISLSFCRRKGEKNPIVIYNTRASEVTSRLIFDFLLIQRIVEYVYGKGVSAEVLCFIPFMFINIERALFYLGYKGRDIVKAEGNNFTAFQKKVLNKFDEFSTRDVNTIKYKVHKRSALQIQKNPKTGKPLANAPDLLAKDLTFPFNQKLKDKDIEKLNADLTKS